MGTNSVDTRGKIGGLFVGWAFITGLALTFASALYGRTHDVKTILVWVGFPFAVFSLLVLLVGVGYVAMWTTDPKKKKKGTLAPGEGVRHTRRQTPYGTRR